MALESSGSNLVWSSQLDIKANSSMDSASVPGNSETFRDTHKLQDSNSECVDPNLHMMGLSLSPQAVDWHQALLRGGKAESSFHSILQEESNSNTNFPQVHWNQGFSIDQPQFSSHEGGGSTDSTVTCQGLPTSFQMDTSVYGNPSTVMEGFFGAEHQLQQPPFHSRPPNFGFPGNYGVNPNEALPSWSRFPQFLKSSPSNQPNCFQPMESQFRPPIIDNKTKHRALEVHNSGSVMKKISCEPAIKRARSEATSPSPALKARKEKMGDRITALQQLVSPFGKTDTASVLSEAIEYIKLYHEQVSILSNAYMKSGAPTQYQQPNDNSKDPEGRRQDLRSRGLCLVPVSNIFPITHEASTVDFWMPTFGGTFR